MRRPLRAAAALAAVLLFLHSPLQAETKRVALLVGVDRYEHGGFGKLECAENDVDVLGAELRRLDFKTVVLTGTGNAEYKATRQNIQQQLQAVLEKVAKGDVVVVALVGQGAQLETGAANGPMQDSFFCPVDAIAGQPETMLSLSTLVNDELAKREARKIVLVDACRDTAPRLAEGSSNGIPGRLVACPKDTSIFFSCRSGQKSFEDVQGLNHGLFTYAVSQALRNSGRNGATVRWYDLVSKVTQGFQSPEIIQAVPAQRMQEPILTGDMPDFVLAGAEAELPAVAEHRTRAGNATGFWQGEYVYPPEAERQPVPFVILLIQQGDFVTGFLREPNTFGDASYPFLYASIDGKIESTGRLSFKKTYDGTASVNHAVNYQGQLSTDARTLTNGTWDIPKSWGGTFTLQRQVLAETNEHTGIWNGTYYYQRGTGLQPVDFQFFALHSGKEFVGFIKEPNTFGNPDAKWLYAVVDGTYNPKSHRLTFKKTYDGTGGQSHDVKYGGELSSDNLSILDGTWEINANATGDFKLHRFFP